MWKDSEQSTRLAAFLLAVALVAVMAPDLALAQAEDPFAKSTTFLNETATSARNVVTALAGVGLVIVIAMAMVGKLAVGWAVKIVSGLIVLTGTGWIVTAITGQ
ncbi:TrbC/VirB2 family protein [Marinibaculum pumilum]|uniref:TrbC/VirB2 family protein n=1 Tax=Marinibaculum pumilum TaxID=1766165 RepID=A0ABV7L6X9_9PROT